jgi:GNAT superfamily N-acetyltransferase
VLRAALHDYADADFVHSIAGRILVEARDGEEEDGGRIGASLVQFSEALDHGIDTARLGDGISGEIAEYWENLFDVETGHLKGEIQTEYEVASLDLLIFDYIEVYPKFRGLGIGVSAINRTIDVFGGGCGLIACKPWPLQFTPAIASDRDALKRLDVPKAREDVALRKLRAYWSRIGFWPVGNTGIYLLSVSQREGEHRPWNSGTH